MDTNDGKTGLTSGVSAYGSNGSSLVNVGYNAQTFLPKTTFNFTPGSAPSCLPPTCLTATEDQPYQSVLSWTANNGETSWNIYYKKASTTTYTEIADVTDNPYTLTNLEPGTDYLFYVVANCTETSNPSAVFPFTTACGIISTYAWNENFDSYIGTTSGTTNNLPLCWNYINTTTYDSEKGYPIVYNSSTYAHSGDNYLSFYSSYSQLGNTNPQPQYAILPEMTALNGKQIEFYARGYNSTDKLKVGVMTAVDDASTFVQIGDDITLTTSHQKFTVSLESYEGTGHYIALMIEAAKSTTTSRYAFVDDISVKPLPDCATPTGLAVTANSQTPEGATITWTAGDASSWIVEYKTSTDENYTAIAEPVNEATYTFTGLNYSTTYNVRVKVNCTAGSSVTYPTDPVNFTTKVQFPAPTNLETSNLTPNSVTLAWTAGYTNQTAWKVQYKKSSDEWTAAVTETVANPTINLNDLVANTAYNVRIYGGIGENFGTDYLSGDFTTKNPNAAPTDFVVSNLTASSVTISWTPGYTTQDHWTVEYKKSTEEWTAASTENVTSPTINLDNLKGLTTYNVRIYYAEANKLTGNFTTNAGTPFTEGFATTSLPEGWTRYSGKMSQVLAGTAILSTYNFNFGWDFNTHNNVFNNHAYCNTYYTYYYWLVTPGVVLGNNECHVNFDVAFTAWSGDNSAPNIGDYDMFAVLVSTDNGTTWTLIAAWNKTGTDNGRKLSDLSNGNDAISTLMSFDLSSYSNQTVKVAFYSQGSDNNHDNCIHVDNVEIDINQDCDKPVLTLDDKTATTADFSWTDGDGTTTWTLNYKKTADEDWTVVNGIATNSYQIPNLEAETSYDVRVLASCNIYWSNTVTFETASACETPDGLAASNVTASSADISWNTYGQTVFNLRYSTDGENWTVKNNVSTPCSLTELSGAKVYKVQVQAACNTEVWSTTLEFQTPFEVTELTTFFEDFEGDVFPPDCWTRGNTYTHYDVTYWNSSTDHPHNNSSKSAYSYYYGPIELYTPTLNITGNAAYLTFWSYNTYPSAYDRNSVLISVDGGAFTQIWSPNSVSQSWVPTTIDLTSYIGHDIVFGFKYEGNNAHGWYLDDVAVTVYDNVFTTEGDWATAANWSAGSVPTQSDNVFINANATISTTATANNITIANEKILIINDGGQLIHTGDVSATLKKNVTGYSAKNVSGWYTIASPVAGLSVDCATTGTYDFYKYSEADIKWLNEKVGANSITTFEQGIGYLYANSSTTVIDYQGTLIGTETEVTKALSYACENATYKGLNLMGNPFSRNIVAGDIEIAGTPVTTYYSVEGGSELTSKTLSETPIKPGQGFIVQATAESQNLVFNPSAKSRAAEKVGYISIAAGNSEFTDNAFVQIGGGNTLRKMILSENVSHVYVMSEGKDYAAATIAEAAGEMPVNFKAATNGTYTINVSTKGIEANYLHLIDNRTGVDVDLLQTPSYTFEASKSDYACRFRLVFSASNNNESHNENFGFISNGNLMILGIEGEATLQMIDVTGRILSSETFSGDFNKAVNAKAGLYMLRLIQGENVRTQKIVVR